jgi:uncharacterized membrane protein
MIQPTSPLSGFYRTDALTSSAGQKTPAPNVQADTGDRLSSSQTDSLRQALANTSEVRPEVVKRARGLAVDPNYPPRAIIESLSKMMIESRDLTESA